MPRGAGRHHGRSKALVRTMKARGARTLLVSGGFTRFTGPVAAEIGFDMHVANVLEIATARCWARSPVRSSMQRASGRNWKRPSRVGSTGR
ncbi:haloacid dehalogenase-like hydrolase [Sphingobium sp. Ant17]|uniref:haloacid dehalogenase-like hydrolase n=1 Tax=Sphingobium sp. Ant17 TaxID=1461752 RepID=UPI003FA78B63